MAEPGRSGGASTNPRSLKFLTSTLQERTKKALLEKSTLAGGRARQGKGL